ncbi:unnamed protein product [Schistosoma curassoni]|uniref:Uncharacterized protein n=1 Tax=Schistosoma curassoni TaxID=6186 RepID=A0A183L4W9_9TREM|nr:unnamed protein product [Schistosoma curassoni]
MSPRTLDITLKLLKEQKTIKSLFSIPIEDGTLEEIYFMQFLDGLESRLLHLRYWSPCAPPVWNQGFPNPLSKLSVSTTPVKASDILSSSSQFRKQHPRHEKAKQQLSRIRQQLSLEFYEHHNCGNWHRIFPSDNSTLQAKYASLIMTSFKQFLYSNHNDILNEIKTTYLNPITVSKHCIVFIECIEYVYLLSVMHFISIKSNIL